MDDGDRTLLLVLAVCLIGIAIFVAVGTVGLTAAKFLGMPMP